MYKLMIGEAKIDMLSLMNRAEQLYHRQIKAKCELIALAGGKVCYLEKEKKRIYWVEFDTEAEAVLFKLTHM